MIKQVRLSLKTIDFRLLTTLLVIGFVPTLYKTARVHFLGDLPIDWGFNIASQLAWINVVYEVLQEAILLPLFYLIGKSITNKLELQNKIKTGLVISFSIYALISIAIILFTKPLTVFMSQKEELISATVTYIRLETVASIFYTLVQFLMLVFVSLQKHKFLYFLLFIQMLLTIVSDVFLLSMLPFSFQMGVNGIAIGNLVVNIILLSIATIFLNQAGYKISFRQRGSYLWVREWIKVGGYSGIESFVRNTTFILMVIKMINVVGEQGTFWVANSFIWGWLLLPILQLGQLIKRDCGELGDSAIKQKTLGYFAITGFFILVWLITMPFWSLFIEHVMNVENYIDVYQIVLISLIFYIAFAFNNVIDSIFYGIGKTNYMLFQSIVINTLFYGGLFILYEVGIYKPTLTLIAIMFGVGIALDSLLTYLMFIWVLRKRKINILHNRIATFSSQR